MNTHPKEITGWLKNLSSIDSDKLAYPEFLKPFHFVTLALACRMANLGELKLPDNLRDYAIRMGLYNVTGLHPPHHVTEHEPAGRFLPLQKLGNTDQQVTNRIIETCYRSQNRT